MLSIRSLLYEIIHLSNSKFWFNKMNVKLYLSLLLFASNLPIKCFSSDSLVSPHYIMDESMDDSGEPASSSTLTETPFLKDFNEMLLLKENAPTIIDSLLGVKSVKISETEKPTDEEFELMAKGLAQALNDVKQTKPTTPLLNYVDAFFKTQQQTRLAKGTKGAGEHRAIIATALKNACKETPEFSLLVGNRGHQETAKRLTQSIKKFLHTDELKGRVWTDFLATSDEIKGFIKARKGDKEFKKDLFKGELVIDARFMPDKAWKVIEGMTWVTSVRVENTHFSHMLFRTLKTLPLLETLVISNSSIFSFERDELQYLKRLKSLAVENCYINKRPGRLSQTLGLSLLTTLSFPESPPSVPQYSITNNDVKDVYRPLDQRQTLRVDRDKLKSYKVEPVLPVITLTLQNVSQMIGEAVTKTQLGQFLKTLEVTDSDGKQSWAASIGIDHLSSNQIEDRFKGYIKRLWGDQNLMGEEMYSQTPHIEDIPLFQAIVQEFLNNVITPSLNIIKDTKTSDKNKKNELDAIKISLGQLAGGILECQVGQTAAMMAFAKDLLTVQDESKFEDKVYKQIAFAKEGALEASAKGLSLGGRWSDIERQSVHRKQVLLNTYADLLGLTKRTVFDGDLVSQNYAQILANYYHTQMSPTRLIALVLAQVEPYTEYKARLAELNSKKRKQYNKATVETILEFLETKKLIQKTGKNYNLKYQSWEPYFTHDPTQFVMAMVTGDDVTEHDYPMLTEEGAKRILIHMGLLVEGKKIVQPLAPAPVTTTSSPSSFGNFSTGFSTPSLMASAPSAIRYDNQTGVIYYNNQEIGGTTEQVGEDRFRLSGGFIQFKTMLDTTEIWEDVIDMRNPQQPTLTQAGRNLDMYLGN